MNRRELLKAITALPFLRGVELEEEALRIEPREDDYPYPIRSFEDFVLEQPSAASFLDDSRVHRYAFERFRR